MQKARTKKPIFIVRTYKIFIAPICLVISSFITNCLFVLLLWSICWSEKLISLIFELADASITFTAFPN